MSVSRSGTKRDVASRYAREQLVRLRPLALVLAAVALLVPWGGAARAAIGATNTTELDNGVCGQGLQIGSDPTASSSATPSFMIWAAGSPTTYAMKVDGVSIGSSVPAGNSWNDCIKATVALANGAHVLTGIETVGPTAGAAVTPFNFSVDTVPPSTPTNLRLSSSSDSGVIGDNVTTFTTVTVLASVDPKFGTSFFEGSKMVGVATDDANGIVAAAVGPFSLGAHTVTARTIDEAGNVGAASAPLTITIVASDSTTTTTVRPTTTTAPPTTTTSTTVPRTTTTSPPTTTTTLPGARVPSAPTGLVASGTKNVVKLSWAAPPNGGSPITSYLIYRGTASGSETLLAFVAGTSTSFMDHNVARRATYYYRALAGNAIGTGPLSSEARVTLR
jgi:hypothetical protein